MIYVHIYICIHVQTESKKQVHSARQPIWQVYVQIVSVGCKVRGSLTAFFLTRP